MKNKDLNYSQVVKLRFKPWEGMDYPFHKFIEVFILWYGWGMIDRFLKEWFGHSRYLIEFPFTLLFLVFGIPCLICGIVINNSRILWRYFKHVAYKITKGKQK